MTIPIVSCFFCERFTGLQADGYRCTAFEKPIPDEIIMGENDHTKPFKGDGGLLFVPEDALAREVILG